MNPATFEGKNGIQIIQMDSRLKKSILEIEVININEKINLLIKTSNVNRFKIFKRFFDCYFKDFNSLFEININNNKLNIENSLIDIELCKSTLSSRNKEWIICLKKGNTNRDLDEYRDKLIEARQTYNYGPSRQAFQSNFFIIVGTQFNNTNNTNTTSNTIKPSDLLDAARYISIGHLHASS
jgi:hypothetical protein